MSHGDLDARGSGDSGGGGDASGWHGAAHIAAATGWLAARPEADRVESRPAEDRPRALWVTALATGLRQGELPGLRFTRLEPKTERSSAGRMGVGHADPSVRVIKT